VSSVSSGLYFLILPLVSAMRVIYTSKGMSKKFGVRVMYQKIRYLNLPKAVLEHFVVCYDNFIPTNLMFLVPCISV
jgi:hypothetical protein